MAIDRDNFKRTSSVDFGGWLTNAAQAIQPGGAEPSNPARSLEGRATIIPATPSVPKLAPSLPKATTPNNGRVAMPRPPVMSRRLADMEGIVVKKTPVLTSPSAEMPLKSVPAALAPHKPVRQPVAQKSPSKGVLKLNEAAMTPHIPVAPKARTVPVAERLPIITDTSDGEVLFTLQGHDKKRPWKYILWPLGMTALFALSFGLAGLTSPRGTQHASEKPQVQGVQTVAAQESATSDSAVPLGTGETSAGSVGQASSASTSVPASQQRKSVLKGIEVTITAQPLPTSYKGDPGALQQVAKNMGAQESFTSTKWGTVYILTKGNEQAVLCANAQQLVVAQVTSKIALDDWKPFMEAL